MSTDPEELFPPKPGGMIDTARKKMAADAEQLAGANSAQVQDSSGYSAVRVRDEQPDLGIPRTITLSSGNPTAQVLPLDPGRRSAILLAVDNDVYLSNSLGNAQNVAGGTTGAGTVFYLPAGTPIPILNKGAWWASVTTTSGISRVSVLISKDSDS